MHETRNFLLVIAVIAAFLWGFVAWFILGPEASLRLGQRIVSIVLFAGFGAWLLYALWFEDKLPNHLKETVGGIYYEVDGMSIMPIIRARGEQAEISLYYQNRYENLAETVVHLRPPEDCFIIRPGLRDVHFAFRAGGGDFGVIHQPISVPQHLQGEVVEVELAAACHYPRSHGARWRREAGMPCGSLNVDWGGAQFKVGVHEVSGELELIGPSTLRLSMPAGVRDDPAEHTWTQERIVAGEPDN